MTISVSGLLRFTCAWDGSRGGVSPSAPLLSSDSPALLSPSVWARLVSRVTGFGLHELQVDPPGKVGDVWRCSVSTMAPHEVEHAARNRWTRDLEAELGSGDTTIDDTTTGEGTPTSSNRLAGGASGFAVAVTVGEMARLGPALVVMDADSTLFAGEGIDLVAAQAGVQQQVAAITAAAMRGELDFAASLRARMGALAGLSVDVLEAVREEYAFSPGASQMIAAFRRNGTRLGVVSGGFVELVEEKARAAGVDYVLANRFEVAGGVLTGRPLSEIVTADSKEQALVEWAGQLGVPVERCVAMGDGANDLKMVTRAGLGIAFCAKPALADVADARLPFPNLAAAAALLLPA
ncbi:phosphoserine phosphatase SerB [Mobiluncus mulieris]|uniref:phosphoserine phosphatase SerB n=1 Tax=Mobiluncus mulieris TaxID=2052 RepID=UPI0021E1E0AE|nr:phosphoserine phosphatase SerB [Mobiluncus mulieris]